MTALLERPEQCVGDEDASHDVLGRMISRTDSTGTTYFGWDGMDCIQELSPTGELTNYYMPQGVLISFDRFRPEPRPVYGMGKYGTDLYWHRSVYNVMTDGLGSVRQVRDTNGVLVAQYDSTAWGEPLPSTFDSIPNGGCNYRWVGSRGVRYDAATGLYYMRARWYDPQIQRFISRDQYRTTNQYMYAFNNPEKYIDPSGQSAENPKTVVLKFDPAQLAALNAAFGCGSNPITAQEIASSFQGVLQKIPGLETVQVWQDPSGLMPKYWNINLQFDLWDLYDIHGKAVARDVEDVSGLHQSTLSIQNMAGLNGAEGLRGFMKEWAAKNNQGAVRCDCNNPQLRNLILNTIMHALGHGIVGGSDYDRSVQDKYYGTLMAPTLIANMPAVLNGPLPFDLDNANLIHYKLTH
jgi:RHS repeat-associated protein